jgi:GxxExxY protein
MTINALTRAVIGAAIEVHRRIGPGLLESAYQACLAREFLLRGIPFEAQKELPVEYKGVCVPCGYRLDFLVAGQVVVEIKSIERFEDIHGAQLLTYLRLGGWKVGLAINFNVPILVNGIMRRVIDLDESEFE